jgi:hypothetical protein
MLGSNPGLVRLWNWQSARSHPFNIYIRSISDLEFMVRSAVMVGVEDIQVGLPHVLQNRLFFTHIKNGLVLIHDKISQSMLCLCFLSFFIYNFFWLCTSMLTHFKKRKRKYEGIRCKIIHEKCLIHK